jgi:hypothetical protein
LAAPLSAKAISEIGLALDFLGIAILFKFQVDRNHGMSPDGAMRLILEQTDHNERRKWLVYRKLTWLGFVLLMAGFALQFIGSICS